MRRDRFERSTAESGPPRLVGPSKGGGNRGKGHIGSRTAMDIIGVGIDATEISRIADSIERWGDRFVGRVFTPGEIAYCRRRRDSASSFAARFAAKEAAMKALGTGHSRGVFWTGIEVVRRHGPPQLTFHGGAAARFAQLGGTGSLLTLTHSRDLAIAHVLLVRG